MTYFVYILKCVSSVKKRTYVGYTNDLKNRLNKHNSNKGAKYTKGNKWIIIYKRKFFSKYKAMSYEYKLKHDRKKRLEIYNNSK
tara:strand:- start:496 stop:747 length:252 start_codon:yes stop_codon:yes gene_type:complete